MTCEFMTIRDDSVASRDLENKNLNFIYRN